MSKPNSTRKEAAVVAGRLEKVKRLVKVCQEVGASADEVEQWTEANWGFAVEILNLRRNGGKTKVPSDTTRSMILAMLRGREERTE